MFPQSRERRGRISSAEFNQVITAEFRVPSSRRSSKKGLTISPQNIIRDASPYKILSRGRKKQKSTKDESPDEAEPFNIRLDSSGATWKLDICQNWLYKLSPPPRHYDLIKGSIYFRRKYFGNWEPIEFLRYFAMERCDDEKKDSDSSNVDAEVGTTGERIVHSIFPMELLDSNISECSLEMTLRFAHYESWRVGSQEIMLSEHRAEMHNKLLPTPLKSDFVIKVDDEEFFVHQKQITAFSNSIKVLKKRKGKGSCDWSDLMTPDSTRAILQYIYYDEVEAINTPEVAFRLLKFSQKYDDTFLSKICENRLMKSADEMYTLQNILEMYFFIKTIESLHKLEHHFVGLLSRHTKQFGTTEFKNLTQCYKDGLVKELLTEMEKFKEAGPEEDKSPPKKKRRKRKCY